MAVYGWWPIVPVPVPLPGTRAESRLRSTGLASFVSEPWREAGGDPSDPVGSSIVSLSRCEERSEISLAGRRVPEFPEDRVQGCHEQPTSFVRLNDDFQGRRAWRASRFRPWFNAAFAE